MSDRLATVHYLRTARRCTEMPDRYGDPEDPDQHKCNDGWIGDYLNADHPEPCTVCKPWTDPAARRADLERRISGPPEPLDWSGRRAQHGDG